MYRQLAGRQLSGLPGFPNGLAQDSEHPEVWARDVRRTPPTVQAECLTRGHADCWRRHTDCQQALLRSGSPRCPLCNASMVDLSVRPRPRANPMRTQLNHCRPAGTMAPHGRGCGTDTHATRVSNLGRGGPLQRLSRDLFHAVSCCWSEVWQLRRLQHQENGQRTSSRGVGGGGRT